MRHGRRSRAPERRQNATEWTRAPALAVFISRWRHYKWMQCESEFVGGPDLDLELGVSLAQWPGSERCPQSPSAVHVKEKRTTQPASPKRLSTQHCVTVATLRGQCPDRRRKDWLWRLCGTSAHGPRHRARAKGLQMQMTGVHESREPNMHSGARIHIPRLAPHTAGHGQDYRSRRPLIALSAYSALWLPRHC